MFYRRFLHNFLCSYSDLPGIAKDPPHSAGDVFAERAISYMAESFDDPNVENVQGIFASCIVVYVLIGLIAVLNFLLHIIKLPFYSVCIVSDRGKDHVRGCTLQWP